MFEAQSPERASSTSGSEASPFEIRVSEAPADDERRVLKHGDTFAVYDRYGDLGSSDRKGETGIYHEGTRFLSRSVLTLNGQPLMLLNSAVDEENVALTVDLTNSDSQGKSYVIPRGVLHLHREKLLFDGSLLERLTVTSYAKQPLECTLRMDFAADFVDIFEVRGASRASRGRMLSPHVDEDGLMLGYEGLDQLRRHVHVMTDPRPVHMSSQDVEIELHLQPRQSSTIEVRIECLTGERAPAGRRFDRTRDRLAQRMRSLSQLACRVETSNEHFNAWLNRSYADLFMMATETIHGLYPYAGVPWYSTVFGRDGLITALQCLWIAPDLARGVLRFLAAHQADQLDPRRDAEPGKIVHEMREGEMARLDEIPFGLYYGTVDATPLFVVLAAEYYDRTGDRTLIRKLWPNIERAVRWMIEHGDVDGDGFLEYARHGEKGLEQQGWKDSFDSVFHEDGSDAEPPIALCEVQGYAYAAFQGAARVALDLGHSSVAEEWARRAESLRKNFLDRFWMPDLGTYALALDGQKKPCRVRTSNAGHCLWTGIAEPQHAVKVADTLLDGHHFSGWGIRTLDDRERRYNPMSYHNGSIWPHDNAIVGAGFARYGLREHLLKTVTALLDVSLFAELNRLPELFCGFPRRRAQGPTHYPVACAPQAWASGAVFLLLESCLSVEIDALTRRIVFDRPVLPPFLPEVRLRGLRVGDASVDLDLVRDTTDFAFEVVRKEGDLEIVVLK